MRRTWFLCVVLAGVFASGCGGCGGEDRDVAEAPQEAPVPDAPAEPPVPSDPLLAEIAAVAATGRALPPPDPADRSARESFRREALTLGNKALDSARIDGVVAVAEALWRSDEAESASAFLQRAVGVARGKTEEKAHMHALARLKVEKGAELEAASLMERAIDLEPTTPEDFTLLSWAYLRAGRIGPAAAATRRGARGHAGAPELAVQAAEVTLVKSGAADALAELAAIPPPPDSEQFLRVRGEAHLVAGDRAAAAADAAALQKAFPSSAWGPLLTAALGGAGRETALAKAKVAAAADMMAVDARAAMDWAASAGESVAPWTRGVPPAPPVAPPKEPVAAAPAGAPPTP
jgi:hypothetical protein